MPARGTVAVVPPRLLVLTVAILALSAAPAVALPFHGFNALQLPCTPEQTYPGTPTAPNNCIDDTHYRLPAGQFVYRFRSDAECSRDRARRTGRGLGSPPTWNFEVENKAIDRMRANRPGAEPFMILTSGADTPTDTTDCMRNGGYQMPSNDTERAAWYWFIRAAVSNAMTKGVQDLEIWNEPNFSPANGGQTPNATNYARTYCVASQAVTAQGGTMRIHLGGIADGHRIPSDPASPNEGTHYYSDGKIRIRINTWMRDVKNALNTWCPGQWVMHGVSHHFYPDGVSDDASGTGTDPGSELGERTKNARLQINTYFGSDKLLMVTETGWDANNANAVGLILDSCWSNRHRDYIRACYSWAIQEVSGSSDRSNYGMRGPIFNDGAKPSWSPWNARLSTHICC